MPTPGKKSSKSSRRQIETGGSQPRNLWSLRGMEDVSFQRGSQVNFWTVMGGLQTAALLTQASLLWEQIQAGRWYLSLYFFNSALIVALIWAISSWDSLILRWAISIPAILTQFLGNFALAVTFLSTTNPPGWSLGLAIAATCNLLHQIVLSRLGAWDSFSTDVLKARKTRLWVFSLWPILCLAGAVHMFRVPSPLVQAIWGLAGLVVIITGLFQQHSRIELERKELGIP